MKFILDKINYIILLIIIILLFWIFNIDKNAFINSYKYKDGLITIKIYNDVDSSVSKKIKKIVDTSDEPGYKITNLIINYFKERKIDKYIINENGNITTGKRYGKNKYKISINSDDGILKIVNVENESVGKISNDLYEQLVVIAKSNDEANKIKYMLSKLSIDDGMNVAKEKNVSVLWYKDGKLITTDDFKKYEK